MLRVTLLGGAAFTVDQAMVRTDLGPAGRLLACFLFEFMGQTHRRERLADLFWGELEPEKARSALNTAVWRIRKMLDRSGARGANRLVTIGDDVVLEPADFIEVDTHALESAFRRAVGGRGAGPLSARDEDEVGDAVARYRGPFLDGDDGDWVLQERERLHCLFVRSTLELMRAAARRGLHENALDCGRRILALDPLRESVQREVMLLLVLNGQRADAIHAYQRLRGLLKADLGIEPMPDTRRLHHDIVSGAIFENLGAYSGSYFGEATTC